MAAPSPSPSPLDEVRAAFERLATADKTAFVFEATFQTIGQAVTETGRTVSEAVESLDLDSLFKQACSPSDGAKTDAGSDSGAAPSDEAQAPAPPKKRSTRKKPPTADDES